jgi:hypothetical protein
MPLSNAEKQARWGKRNLIALTDPVQEIVHRLVTMEDRVKLALIVAFLNQQLNPKDGRCRFVKDDGGRSRSGIARGGAKDEVGDCVAQRHRHRHGDALSRGPRRLDRSYGSPCGDGQERVGQGGEALYEPP